VAELEVAARGNARNLVNAGAAPPGHGVLLWFQVDFDSVVERARGLGLGAPIVGL